LFVRLADARLFGDIGEGAVAIIVVQTIAVNPSLS
jgi:hypothetical protein